MTKWADQIYFKSAIDAEKIGGIGILYNDNSIPQKIYLGYGREPWNTGLTIDSNIKFNNHKIYHEGFKPTPADIGAINKNGDEINGNFNFINGSTPINIVTRPEWGGWARGMFFSDSLKRTIATIGAYGSNGNIAETIFLGFDDDAYNGVNSFKITKKNCFYKNNKIYHEGFKPTPADIGAQPLESTTFNLYTNGKYVAVRTPNRTKEQYYEFWDNNIGWAEIHSGTIAINEGVLKIKNKVSIQFNSENNAIEFVAL